MHSRPAVPACREAGRPDNAGERAARGSSRPGPVCQTQRPEKNGTPGMS